MNYNPGPAETRCCIKEDAGYTKATLHDPKKKKNYFCIYFARGCCHLGSDCGFQHLLPTDKDEKRYYTSNNTKVYIYCN